jgi:hypothetical protein
VKAPDFSQPLLLLLESKILDSNNFFNPLPVSQQIGFKDAVYRAELKAKRSASKSGEPQVWQNSVKSRGSYCAASRSYVDEMFLCVVLDVPWSGID